MRYRPSAGFVDMGRRRVCSTCAPRLRKNLEGPNAVVGHYPPKDDPTNWGSQAGTPITKVGKSKAHERMMKKKYRKGGDYFNRFD